MRTANVDRIKNTGVQRKISDDDNENAGRDLRQALVHRQLCLRVSVCMSGGTDVGIKVKSARTLYLLSHARVVVSFSMCLGVCACVWSVRVSVGSPTRTGEEAAADGCRCGANKE